MRSEELQPQRPENQTYHTPEPRDAQPALALTTRTTGILPAAKPLRPTKVPAGTDCLWLSDGGHNHGPETEVLDYVKANVKGRIHTIAIECPKGSAAENAFLLTVG